MTDFYISPSTGSDSSGTGSQANPYRTWAKVMTLTPVAGDNIYLRRGDTFTEALLNNTINGTAANRITVDAYGSGNKPVIAPNATYSIDFGGSGGGGWTVRNLAIKPIVGGAAVSFQSSATIGSTFEFLDIDGQNRNTTGFYTIQTWVSGTFNDGMIWQNNTITNCASFGFSLHGSLVNWGFRNNVVTNCASLAGKDAVGHDVKHVVGGVTWSLSAGNVYVTNIAQYVAQNVDVIHSVGLQFAAGKYAPLDAGLSLGNSTPAFCYSFDPGAQKLYVNLNGVDVTTSTQTFYEVGYSYGWVYEGNTIDTVLGGSSTEGDGILTDDWAGRGTIRGNLIKNCSGNGIHVHLGANIAIYGNIVVNCATAGGRQGNIMSINGDNGARNVNIFNNSIVNHPTVANAIALQWVSTLDPQTAIIQNNIIQGGANSHYLVSGAATTWKATNNCCFGFSASEQGGPQPTTSDVNVNPTLDALYRPQNASLRAAGTNAGGQTFYSNDFPLLPDIGAVMYYPARSIATLSTDNTRTTTTGRSIAAKRAIAYN
jgi:hypothetical protein